MPRTALFLTLAMLGGVSSATAAKMDHPSPMPKVAVLMKSVVDKASTDLFTRAGNADPANGADQILPDAKGWTDIQADATRLKSIALELQSPKTGKIGEVNWMVQARAMESASTAALHAAVARNPGALAQAANDLSDTCSACHAVYKKQR